MQSIEYRYNNDPMVKALVDSLTSAIMHLKLTPSEIRECAMLAALNYERNRPPQVQLGGVYEQPLTGDKIKPADITPLEEPIECGYCCTLVNGCNVCPSCGNPA